MTKKVTIRWNESSGAAGYHTYLSKFSSPLEYNGTTFDTYVVLNNQEYNDILNFGVQAFNFQEIDGINRRVCGHVAVIQIDLATEATHGFFETVIGTITIEEV